MSLTGNTIFAQNCKQTLVFKSVRESRQLVLTRVVTDSRRESAVI